MFDYFVILHVLVSLLVDPIPERLFLVRVMQLLACGTLGLLVEQCGRFMGMKGMLML